MTYNIVFSEPALRQLKRLDSKTQARIISVLERIRVRPERFVRKLVNDPGYKLRAGDYIVILDIEKFSFVAILA